MDECMISQREILYLGVSVAAFFDTDDRPSTTLFEAGRRRLREEFVPLMELGLPADEIIHQVNAGRSNNGNGDNWVAWDLSMVMSGVTNCTEDIGGCLIENDVAAGYAANFGLVYRIWDKAVGLDQIGDVSDIFLSSAGMMNVIRLEDKSGGEYASWDRFLEALKERYVYTRTSMLLHNITNKVGSTLGLLPVNVYASDVIDSIIGELLFRPVPVARVILWLVAICTL
jgi:hypothetical protein